MRLISQSEIWSVYSMAKALDDVAAAFVATSNGNPLLPLRTRLNLDDNRTVLVMPAAANSIGHLESKPTAKVSQAAASSGAVAVKTISLYPENARKNLPTAPATLLLLDAETGMAKAILDGDTVTKIRTGASSGVAFRYLADPDTEIGLVVGTGGQAYTQVLAMIAAFPKLKEIRIANPELQLAKQFIAQLKQWAPFQSANYQGKLVATVNADEAAIGAKAIVLVTSSHRPVMSAKNLEPGVVISCVGSYQPHMQECGADIVAQADLIVCDQVKAAVEESGDLIIPLEDGVISEKDLQTEIGQVIAGTVSGRTSPDQIIVYETVGVGTQDLWTANAIYQQAEQLNIGQNWEQLA